MRTVTIAAAAMMIALLPATAYSQHQPATARTDAQKKEDAEIEKAYQEVTKGKKGQAAPAKTNPWDPWHTIRPAAGGDSGKK
jgi:hypothetical protein